MTGGEASTSANRIAPNEYIGQRGSGDTVRILVNGDLKAPIRHRRDEIPADDRAFAVVTAIPGRLAKSEVRGEVVLGEHARVWIGGRSGAVNVGVNEASDVCNGGDGPAGHV